MHLLNSTAKFEDQTRQMLKDFDKEKKVKLLR